MVGRALVRGRGARGSGFGGASRSTLSFATPPPDFSAINDPNLIVSFKSLLKKNDATLTKALEDIRTYVVKAIPNGLEAPVLKAWAELYPRIAINNSRRVRELSHLVQSAILDSAKTSIRPYLGQMVPTWLAGTFDNDKGVAKAATSGWESLLHSDEKMASLLKQSQGAVLAYAQEGLDETPETLSDERSMSPDDVKATYIRLIGNCIDMVTYLMKSLSEDDRKKYSSKYETFFGTTDFLECTSSEDAHLRRSSIRLINTCVFRHSSIIKSNLKLIAQALLSHALNSNQLGSAYDLLELVKILTAKFPEIWTETSSKKGPLIRFRTFVEKGSQRGDSGYWPCLASLVAIMPPEVLHPKTVTLLDVLSSVRTGIRNRDEPKTNLPIAWAAYIKITQEMMVNKLSDPDSKVKLAQEALLPLMSNFTLMAPGESAWSTDARTVESVLQLFSSLDSGTLRDRVRDLLVEDLVSSAKKLETDLFSPLNDGIIASRLSRWFQVVDWVFANSELKAYLGSTKADNETILSITERLVRACPKVIEGRQGASYGAASGLAACMLSSALIKESPELLDFVTTYLGKQLFSLLLTPSGEYLLSALNALKSSGRQEAFNLIWSTTMRKVLESDPSDRQVNAVALMLRKGDSGDLALEDNLLQKFISHHVEEALENDMGEDFEPSWTVLSAAAQSNSISAATFATITNSIIATFMIGSDSSIDRGLRALKCFPEKHCAFLLSSSHERLELLTCLIRLSEDEMDSTDPREPAIQSLTRIVANSDESGFAVSLIEVLQNQLTSIDKSALSIRALGNMARHILATVTDEEKARTLGSLYPSTELFEEITTFYQDGPHASLGACEPFGSALFLVDTPATFSERMLLSREYDDKGHSVPLKVALYLADLMQSTMLSLPASKAAEMLVFLCIVSEHLQAQKVSESMKGLYHQSCGHVQIFVDQLHKLLWQTAANSTDWRRNGKDDVSPHDMTPVLDILVKSLLESTHGTSFPAYYSGLALRNVLSIIVASRGPNFQCTESRLEELKVLRPSKDFETPFTTLAVLTGFGPALQSSESVKKFCKTLIGMFRDFELGFLDEDSIRRAYHLICLLNGCLAVYGEDAIPNASVQLVHAVMKMTSWIDSEDFSGIKFAVASEACRALTKILPAISLSAGSFWTQALTKLCLAPWTMYGTESRIGDSEKIPPEDELFVLCSWSIKLYARLVRLKDLKDEDAFSLKDAFEEDDMQTRLNAGLLSLLEHRRGDVTVVTPYDRPIFAALHETLRPEISKIPLKEIDLERIYPLIDFPIPATQAIAFETLSRALPGIIEEMTLQVALDKEEAELPAELLSLLLTDVLELRPTSADGGFPVSLDRTLFSQRSVLLVWNLVIQCFALAPHQVKVGFTKNLQENDLLKRLLEFVYLTFSTPDGKMKLLSLDKESLRSYDVQDLSHPAGLVHNVRWLTAVNYFQALKFMPQMVRSWYIDFSRAGKAAMQSWTTQNFTPIVLEDVLQDIRVWREDDNDDEEFSVKLPSKTGSTMTLSYHMDDQYSTIQFVFPESYPLVPIEVKSVKRVALPENVWNSVLNSISGAMRFNNGSILDGIQVFRRNVSGYLARHEPCCICYSIISEQMKVPEKNCSTCNQPFHTKCLAQWFSSSNANLCPMCRQPFTGMGRR